MSLIIGALRRLVSGTRSRRAWLGSRVADMQLDEVLVNEGAIQEIAFPGESLFYDETVHLRATLPAGTSNEEALRLLDPAMNTQAIRYALRDLAVWIARESVARDRRRAAAAVARRDSVARFACKWLDMLSLLVPRRIAQEEVGDAMEVVRGMQRADRPAWHVCVKVSTTTFWVFLNALREITGSAWGRARSG